MTTPQINLENTYWYVPTEYLPALRFYPGESDTPFEWVSDQTLWQIEESHDGYFVGKTYAQLRSRDAEPTWGFLVFIGSVTPDGNVYMSFVPNEKGGGAMSTFGIGRIRRRDEQPVFEMQMSTGVTSVLSHWAYMEECKPGDAAWERLPGTNYSVPEFIAECMEQTSESEGE